MTATKKRQRVLVVDVGGTHIKVLATGERVRREIASGPTMSAKRMVREVKKLVSDWRDVLPLDTVCLAIQKVRES